jgi:hypothetical protein
MERADVSQLCFTALRQLFLNISSPWQSGIALVTVEWKHLQGLVTRKASIKVSMTDYSNRDQFTVAGEPYPTNGFA